MRSSIDVWAKVAAGKYSVEQRPSRLIDDHPVPRPSFRITRVFVRTHGDCGPRSETPGQ